MLDKVAYLFTGQGSQYVGMGKDLYESFPESKTVFDRADKVLGFSLSNFCFNGQEERLKSTIISQPAILTTTIAAYEAFKAVSGSQPPVVYMAGLSLGEYSSLIAAGSISFEDGLRLVRKRAELMEDASYRYPGKMVAILDLPVEKIKNICLASGAEIANLNCPGQTVITGKQEAVDKAGRLCLEAGAKRVINLEVSGGFHSSLMFEASVELKVFLERMPFSAPCVPIISNYTGLPQYRITQIQENLLYQMRSPVKWEDSMRFLLAEGIKNFIEFGPGRVLKGLMRRIDAGAQVSNIEKKEDILSHCCPN
ncbi:MAG: ACP S-malonyltransferase [Candidatus Omnitrophota bacterium]|nr:ACP S-malonyltransferase [Candidatus Omnitrophota bacterium]